MSEKQTVYIGIDYCYERMLNAFAVAQNNLRVEVYSLLFRKDAKYVDGIVPAVHYPNPRSTVENLVAGSREAGKQIVICTNLDEWSGEIMGHIQAMHDPGPDLLEVLLTCKTKREYADIAKDAGMDPGRMEYVYSQAHKEGGTHYRDVLKEMYTTPEKDGNKAPRQHTTDWMHVAAALGRRIGVVR